MLSGKPWKADAIARLVVGVFICILAGSLLNCLLHFVSSGGRLGWKLGLLSAGAYGFLGTTLVWLRLPWSAEDFLRRTARLLLCFYAGFLLTAWAEQVAGPPPAAGASMRQVFIGVLSFQGAGLLLTGYFIHQHGLGWRQAFGLSHHWRYALLLGLMLACLYLPAAEVLQRAMLVLVEHLPKLHLQPQEQQAVTVLRAAETWGQRLGLGVVTILLAPVTEEVLFRGILYPWVKQAGFPRLALWGTAVLFAAIHANLVIFLPLFVLAIALVLLYEATDNLLAPIAAHSLFNGLNFVKLYLSDVRAFVFLMAGLVVVLSAALLVLVFNLRRDELK